MANEGAAMREALAMISFRRMAAIAGKSDSFPSNR
jgi:hypothetical protein